MTTQTLDAFHNYLKQISYRGVKPGLDRIKKAAEILGNPQEKYKIIHIAGTNGKGSVCSFLSHLLAVSGYSVGLILSPHVYDYRERIQVNRGPGERVTLIPEDELAALHEDVVKRVPAALNLTYFEWGILLALEYFYRRGVDFAVLETGLGGRWDATNICSSILSGITTIDYDHTEYLGDTKEKILNEKLQIIKNDSHFLFGPDDDSLVSLAKRHCQKQGAVFHATKEIKKCLLDADPRFTEKLAGAVGHIHSFISDNLLFALCFGRILSEQGHHIDYNALLNSYREVIPPARLQIIRRSPDIIIDGAHNEHGLRALREYLVQNYNDDYDLVFGCLKNRSFLKLSEIVKSKNRNFWLVFDGEQRTTPLDIYKQVQQMQGGEIVGLDSAFRSRLAGARLNRPVVVCGSFYLCSQFKKWFESAH
ncbi:MAG: hypothetical protein HQM16_09900 [Deltaproteobacteria bacterium]|nr:hypothetical protein [Deltaproteobacteria bacterium]